MRVNNQAKRLTNEELHLMGKLTGAVADKGCCNCGTKGDGSIKMILPTQWGGKIVESNFYFICYNCSKVKDEVEQQRKAIIRKAIIEGMNKAREEGRPVGRKKLTIDQVPKTFMDNYKRVFKGELTKTRLAEMVGVSRPTIDRYIKLVRGGKQ